MSRELKFRAWDGEKMVSPDFINRAGVAYWEENSITERSSVIMQATGLKDKAGEMVYEGDIIQFSTDDINQETAVIEFQIHSYNAGFYPSIATNGWHYWTVIGNIHQHPELLGEQS